ncbi:SDR family NAD(P)-dependent oxidoreductase [Pseudooceanicola sp. CBS1P-1]|uniref:SDR family NAD(P)-dependent oxidoreductase n=1 Tax=Pseudooceanicola albus TaxID=2692189 RepID=A0A6L7G470_9RHOB|nr:MULTISPECIES: SDR family NAD(P)-dependent oxidoreductase [Pseudooceanicola]MBT9383588.1 SDR family NAD(P)-dependent oxidoreductase [Pseudooceanicola endophyticus]MXN17443.1 SDR family NAD(P)-dependent oxidoreductase [Pseudooceanicola albus]
MTLPPNTPRKLLLIGASRGLGHALSVEFAERGWHVTGTLRAPSGTPLHDLAAARPDRIRTERLEITEAASITALRARLEGQVYDMLFVNAGTTNADPTAPLEQVPPEDFAALMLTNVLGPLRVIAALEDLVRPGGLIGVMSSGQGSLANNRTGGREAYRASKAALNQALRSLSARRPGRPLLLMAPGWIRTALGGPEAPFGLEETIPDIADTLLSRLDRPGLAYLERSGATLPW